MATAYMTPMTDANEVAIYTAISNIVQDDLVRHGCWEDLELLSSRTVFDGMEALVGGIVMWGDGTFDGAADTYVTLNFGSEGDGLSMTDAYPALVRGWVDPIDHVVTIHDIEVDTKSFYGE